MKILVVDDEKEQLESLKIGLRSKGFNVLVALNAEEALKHLDKNNMKVDIVITDYAMPGINGMELLRKIRENDNSLPVIMMTAYGEKGLVIDALRNRCDSFIEKPFTLGQLIQEIKRTEVQMVKNKNSHQFAELIPKIVHQINNPLMAIMGCARVGMLELGDAKTMKKSLTHIIEATEKIQEINKEMLNLGQDIKEKIDKVDIREVLEHCLNMFEDLMTLKGVSVEKDLNEDPLYVLGNRFSFEQLFKNLILNAIDSMDEIPEKLLNIRADVDENASTIAVYIKDTGCGIPEELMDKIFAPYFTNKENGTGIGLQVVKDVVEKHKGRIQLESQLEKGTTFKVKLPMGALSAC